MTTWATLAFTTPGGGAVGSVITAYSSQSRQRRQARSDARQAIRKADRLAADPPRTPRPDFTTGLDDLDTAAGLAGLPRALTELHREACERHWVLAVDHWMGTEAPRHVETTPIEGSTDRQVTEVLECWAYRPPGRQPARQRNLAPLDQRSLPLVSDPSALTRPESCHSQARRA
jgi:hypothetical protein